MLGIKVLYITQMTELLPLIIEPNSLLHQVSDDVELVNDDLRIFMDNMLFSMHHYEGVGLAAVQVGVLKKVIVIEIDPELANGIPQPMFLINAKILNCSKEIKEFKGEASVSIRKGKKIVAYDYAITLAW